MSKYVHDLDMKRAFEIRGAKAEKILKNLIRRAEKNPNGKAARRYLALIQPKRIVGA